MEPAKSDSGATCSDDLAEARRLSRLLSGEAKVAAAPLPGFVRFGAEPAAAAMLHGPPPVVAEAPRPPAPKPAEARPAAPIEATQLPRQAAPRPAAAPAATPPPAPPSGPALSAPPAIEPLRLPDDFGPVGWNRVLDACLHASQGESALLMDPAGLVVAARGLRPTEELEGIGARLMIAFEQAEAIEGSGSVKLATLELASLTLFGARLEAHGARLTLGVLIQGVLKPARRFALEALLRRP